MLPDGMEQQCNLAGNSKIACSNLSFSIFFLHQPDTKVCNNFGVIVWSIEQTICKLTCFEPSVTMLSTHSPVFSTNVVNAVNFQVNFRNLHHSLQGLKLPSLHL